MSMTDELEEVRNQIESLLRQQSEVQKQLDGWEVDPYDLEDMYCDMLDEVYGEVKICGMCYGKSSRLLRDHDPTAYRCGLLDYVDSLEKDGQAFKDHPAWQPYRDLEEQLEDLEDELSVAEEELDELEEQLELEQDEEQ